MTTTALRQQFNRLKVLPGSPKEVDAINAWNTAALKIANQVGDQRFVRAVDLCIETMDFFPMIAQLREKIPARIGYRGERCRNCEATDGWLFHDYYFDGRLIPNAAYKCKHEATA